MQNTLRHVVREDFNPRSSCEERLLYHIHRAKVAEFQSTLLMRGATVEVEKLKSINSISIHAPHARSDDRCHKGCGCHAISIHAPHARSDTMPSSRHSSMTTFQSTLLMRGATTDGSKFHTIIIFQSTLLMRGATLKSFAPAPVNEFQSTLLMRGATTGPAGKGGGWHISIHAPHARSDNTFVRVSLSTAVYSF